MISCKRVSTPLAPQNHWSPLRLLITPNFRSRQWPPRIYRPSNLTRIRPILRIPLITIQVQIVSRRRGPHMLIPFHRLNPLRPPTPHLRIWPTTVWLKYAREPQHPGCEVDVDKGYGRAEEERTVDVGSVD